MLENIRINWNSNPSLKKIRRICKFGIKLNDDDNLEKDAFKETHVV